MQGKTIFITGATDGIGLHTAKQLAKMGANVLVHGRRAPYVLSEYMVMDGFTSMESIGFSETIFARRSQKKAEAAAKEVSRAGGNKSNVQSYAADLSSLDQTKALAQHIQKDHPSVDILLNNAGTYHICSGVRIMHQDCQAAFLPCAHSCKLCAYQACRREA